MISNSTELRAPRRFAAQALRAILVLLTIATLTVPLFAQAEHKGGGEANLVLPDLNSATFLGGIGGRDLLMAGLVVSALGLRVRSGDLHALEEHAGACVHAGGLRADL